MIKRHRIFVLRDLFPILNAKIDMYIFEFWAIQLGILLVPGRYRVPRGYIFMPQVVENRLSMGGRRFVEDLGN